MFKNFINKLRSKQQDIPVFKLQQQKIFNFHYVPPTELNQQQADTQIINSITNINILIEHTKDNKVQQQKLLKLYKILGSQEISKKELRLTFYNLLSYQYYPIRSLIWKILVDYLPEKKNTWISYLESNKKKYQKLLHDNICVTIKKRPKNESQRAQERLQIQKLQKSPPHKQGTERIINLTKDHPLSRNKDSQWNTYFKDFELWTKIERDVSRTRKTVNFFQEQHEYQFQHQSFVGSVNLAKFPRKSFYYDAVARILFLFAKLHPEVGYCQGMNEIAALLYYSFTSKNTEYQRRTSQSDAYFIFQIIMDRIGPINFTNNQTLNKRVKIFTQCLKKIDFKLYQILQVNKIDIKLFTMRWFMVFLLQQFTIDDALLIWDGLLCSQIGLTSYLYYICLAIIFIKRDQFVENPQLIYQLQQIKLKPNQLLQTAYNLYKEYPQLIL